MRAKKVSLVVLALGIATGVAVAQTRPAQPDKDGFIPEITVDEIMASVVMPSAQIVWDAVGVDVSEKGQVEKKPETEEQWAALRAAAITLAEATNSLVVPGRHAAPASKPASDPSSGELSAAAIEELLAKQRPAWIAHAQVLHVAAMQAVAAIDARNLDAISEAGGTIDEACEGCHLQFWYPDQK